MEYHKQSVIIGIGENVLIELQHLLLVATEEIDLYSAYSGVMHPFHFFTALYSVVHLSQRTLRSIVPRTVAVIPKEERNVLLLAVTSQTFNALITYLLVPQGIYEHGLITHVC